MTLAIQHTYEARGGCSELLNSREPELLLSGPAGTGKSRACLEKINLMAMKYPGMRGLLTRKTLTSLSSTTLVTFREQVIAESLRIGAVVYYGGSGEQPPQYRYANGSRLILGGMDKPSRIMSSEYDAVYVNEAIELTEVDWNAITTRLRHGVMPYQQLIADTNPATPTHWLKQRAEAGILRLIESRHTDNPAYYDADGAQTPAGTAYLAKLENLTGVTKLRLRDGLWVGAEGMIYDEFDPAVHVIDPFTPPLDWPRWWSVDFGYTNPFVLQRWATDPDGRLYLYAEQYMSGKLVEDHAKLALAEITRLKEPRPRGIVTDHDAEGRATFEKVIGQATRPAKKNVTEGIQAVQSRLRIAGDGRPRLFIMRGATVQRDSSLIDARKPTSTAEEMPGYIWQDNGKETPVKENDHGADALRYIVCELDLGVRPSVRFLNR